MNKNLRGLNNIEYYLPYIKALYEGVKLKSLPLCFDNILYRGSKISNIEIKKIVDHININYNIIFAKSFISFFKDKNIAECFYKLGNSNQNLSKVLYILEKNNNLGYNLSNHCDMKNISYYGDEREVLFFPFSFFLIKEIKLIHIGNENGYEVKLLYLGKYSKCL